MSWTRRAQDSMTIARAARGTALRAALATALALATGGTLGQDGRPVAARSTTLPPMQRGATLDACAATLEAQAGGWCEIRLDGPQPSIGSVFPRVDKRIRMGVGPAAVLGAWNSGAIDLKRELLYFFGGGHSDYGGNEVYEFDLRAGRWSRLTDPSPLDHLYQILKARDDKPPKYCWIPDTRKVPPSPHTYDGFEFHPGTETLFLIAGSVADGSCFYDEKGDLANDPRLLAVRADPTYLSQFEFNPSRTQSRNGLAPLTWRRVGDQRWKYPRTALLPDGTMLAGSSKKLWRVDVSNGGYAVGAKHSGLAHFGDGTAIFDARRDMVWSLHRRVLLGLSTQGKIVFRLKAVSRHGKSPQLDREGTLIIWSGTNEITVIDPDEPSPTWRTLEWGANGPQEGNNRVYGKWRYIPARDVFVGISTPATGVWVYKHPKNPPLTTRSTSTP